MRQLIDMEQKSMILKKLNMKLPLRAWKPLKPHGENFANSEVTTYLKK
jgi:hypothetical protein